MPAHLRGQRPEDRRYWMHVKSIAGHFAMWSIRQSPYAYPDHLQEAVNSVRFVFGSMADREGMILLSQSSVENILRTFVRTHPHVIEWNNPKVGGDVPFVFTSRYGQPDPDHDIIDIDALARNVAVSLFQELRADHAADNRIHWGWRLGAPLRWLESLRPPRYGAVTDG